jgi:hypothetical protein
MKALIFLLLGSMSLSQGETFRLKSGEKVKGQFVRIEDSTNVVIKGTDGKLHDFPLESLTPEAQKSVKKLKAPNAWELDADWLRLQKKIDLLKVQKDRVTKHRQDMFAARTANLSSAYRRDTQGRDWEDTQIKTLSNEIEAVDKKLSELRAQQRIIEKDYKVKKSKP